MHATIEHVRELYDYLVWGDAQMLAAATAVADEEYYKDRPISMGSIHKLLVHVMAAEWLWLNRWRGGPTSRIENQDDYPTREALRARWPQVHAELRAFVNQQTNESLRAPLRFRRIAGNELEVPLGQAMIHVVDHSTYHRGQLNSMIKQAGGEPAMAYYVTYHARQPGQG